ncbi:MAG: Gfo/Idh/MocA family oxidoreductase [Lactobacillales bacterium]|jgi:predicted dehydrogenase|nr:Gfo/Idh/MocA family oxidoreductase [Lactobacillales bacterium]
MKLALLGTGMIVQDVLPVLKTIEGIELCGVLATAATVDEAAGFDAGPVFTDYAELLASDEIDTVYIGLPNFLHATFAIQALKADKNVIIEKPFTVSFAEFEEVYAAAGSSKGFILEAITNQYAPNYLQIKNELDVVGDVKIVECNYSQYSSRYDAFKRGEILPAFDPKKGGGALMDLNIYNIHFIVGLFGKPEGVQYHANIERSVDTSGILTLDYPTFKAVAIAAKDCAAKVSSTVQGNLGSFRVDGPPNIVEEVTLSLNNGETQTFEYHEHRMLAEFVEFEQIISSRDDEAAARRLAHSKNVMEVLDAAVKSAGLKLG